MWTHLHSGETPRGRLLSGLFVSADLVRWALAISAISTVWGSNIARGMLIYHIGSFTTLHSTGNVLYRSVNCVQSAYLLYQHQNYQGFSIQELPRAETPPRSTGLINTFLLDNKSHSGFTDCKGWLGRIEKVTSKCRQLNCSNRK